MIEIKLPEDVEFILNKIESYNYDAVVVGGSIRNQLINHFHGENYPIKDYDIATNCPYDKLKEIFKEYNPEQVGVSFGVLLIKINGEHYEIALYRKESDYSDGRRPDKVEFVLDLKSDISRRDFRCNGVAYSLSRGLIDYHNGIEDIKLLRLNFIGDADDRLSEDLLRLLRMYRISAQYNMAYKTPRNIRKHVKRINDLSNERIRDEVNEILLCKNPSETFYNMMEDGVIEIILPELQKCVNFNQNSPYHNQDLFGHIMDTLDNTQPILINRLSALMHDLGKIDCYSVDEDGVGHFFGHEKESSIIAEKIMKRLKYNNKTIDSVSRIVKDHMSKSQKITPRACKRFINRVGEENLDSVFDLMCADIKAHSEPHNFTALNTLKSKCKEVLERKEPTKKSHLEINGCDIMELGIKEGKKVGELLEYCMDLVLDNPEINKKEILKKYVIDKLG